MVVLSHRIIVGGNIATNQTELLHACKRQRLPKITGDYIPRHDKETLLD